MSRGRSPTSPSSSSFAYLNSWAEPVEADDTASAAASSSSTSATRPQPQADRLPAGAARATTTARARRSITINTPAVQRRRPGRQQRAVRAPTQGGGGFDLYDVTNPGNPDAAGPGASATSATTTARCERATRPRCERNARTRALRSSSGTPATRPTPSASTTRSSTTSTSSTSPTRQPAARRRVRPDRTRRSAGDLDGDRQRRQRVPPRHGRQADRRQVGACSRPTGTRATSSST